ncbi:MAG: histidinol dehydrogenase [Cyclobacteriaceae bacterium]|nr:histidinol dehydrogenase [Cyclobacteriaceae bacterium]MCH8515391.1 histidinol dehydrogenase [Cyclobacteriaceae bacterium]
MKIYQKPTRDQWSKILERPAQKSSTVRKIVKPILKQVKKKGDTALRRFAKEYDQVDLKQLAVSNEELKAASSQVKPELKDAIKRAYDNIKKFHEAQAQAELILETSPGITCRRKSVAIQKVGLYVPGGTAPLFSTVLMLGIPAKIAGCNEIIICTPTDHLAAINPAILYSASLIGIDKIYKVGGAQAIAAMAYGTESIPAVDKIFGPGNQYVTVAKQMVSQKGTAIDMPAGPSEVAVYADDSSDADFVASDLLSQAEHGPDSQVILVSTSKAKIDETLAAVKKQLADLPRKEIAAKALTHSRAIYLKSREEAIDLLNEYAAEHLILSTDDADEVADQIINAGSVFVGHYTPESAGDYASGTNHTLPTYGYARSYSGVSLDSFVKKITFQRITKKGLKDLGPSIEYMAAAENLHAHKEAVSIRLRKLAK